jgi:hypothetical protein
VSPLPSGRVIHPAWSEHHRPVVASTLTAACTITTTGTPGDWDPTTGPTPGTEDTLYPSGPCRIQALDNATGEADAAEQNVTVSLYLVVIPWDAGPIVTGARVHVDTCSDDVQLEGMELTVQAVRHASLRWERDLICELDLSNQEDAP